MVYSPETVELKYDMRNMELPQVFFGLFFGGEMIGVNSGHVCGDGSFRSRGLWVDPIYRGYGFGIEILAATIAYADAIESTFIWSYPRLSSKKTYEAAGFTITSDWRASETSDSNAYCIKKFVE
jgi:RimJ/RimL family protein N-acetyltransferase